MPLQGNSKFRRQPNHSRQIITVYRRLANKTLGTSLRPMSIGSVAVFQHS